MLWAFLLSAGHLATITFVFPSKTNQATPPGWAQAVSARGSAAAGPGAAPPWHFCSYCPSKATELGDSCPKAAPAAPAHTQTPARPWGQQQPQVWHWLGGPRWSFWFSNISFAFSYMNPQTLADVNYTEAESGNISAAQRHLKMALASPHHISVGTGQVQKPCWIKGQWLQLWTSGTDWPVWKHDTEMLSMLKIKITTRIWCQKPTAYKKWIKTCCSEFYKTP